MSLLFHDNAGKEEMADDFVLILGSITIVKALLQSTNVVILEIWM